MLLDSTYPLIILNLSELTINVMPFLSLINVYLILAPMRIDIHFISCFSINTNKTCILYRYKCKIKGFHDQAYEDSKYVHVIYNINFPWSH